MFAVAAAVGLAGIVAAPAAADVVYSSGFESPGFLPGALTGQQQWDSNGAVVQSVVGPMGGAQSVQMVTVSGSPRYFERSLNVATAGQVVTVSLDYFRQGGAEATSSVGIFGDTGFIGQLRNIGNLYEVGNTNTATPGRPFPALGWDRLVLRLDFVAGVMTGTVDGVPIGPALPINNASPPTRLTLFSVQAGSTAAATNRYDNLTILTSRPVNDLCAEARAITPGATVFSNVAAGNDGPAPTCGTIGADIWYSYTAAATSTVTASTCGANYDTFLVAYSGTCAALTQVACHEDTIGCAGGCPDTLGSRLSFTAAAGQTYRIRVGGLSGASGSGTLTLGLESTGACCNPRSGQCFVLQSAACAGVGLNFLGLGAACSPAACVPCPADFNNAGGVSVQDIFDFLAAYFAGCG